MHRAGTEEAQATVRRARRPRVFRGEKGCEKRARGGWEPSGALREAIGGLPLSPGTDRGEHLAQLRPLLEEALGELGRLGQRGGLSREERAMEEALGKILAASKAPEDRATRAGGDVPPGTRAAR